MAGKEVGMNYNIFHPSNNCSSHEFAPIIPAPVALKWYKVVIHIVFSEVLTGESCPGEIQVWVDGVKVQDLKHVKTFYTIEGKPSILHSRIGIYSGEEGVPVAHALTDYFAGFVVAKTREAAEESAFVAP